MLQLHEEFRSSFQLHETTRSFRSDFLLSCDPEAVRKHCTGRREPRLLAECVDTPQARREVFRALRATLGAPQEMVDDRLLVVFTRARLRDDRIREGVVTCLRCLMSFEPLHGIRGSSDRARYQARSRGVRGALRRAATEIYVRPLRDAFRAATARARATDDADIMLVMRLNVLGTGTYVGAGWLSYRSHDDWHAWLVRNKLQYE